MEFCRILWFAVALAHGGLAPKARAEDWTEREQQWHSALEAVHVPGLALAVVRDGEVLHRWSFGIRDEGGRPVTDETVFYIASTTKSFTGTAICMLAERGELDLDRPVVERLPRFSLSTEEATRSVTIRDLLSHRRGLSAHSAIVFNDAYTGQITEDRFYRLLERSTPSEQFRYNNLHFTILGRVIEAVSGASWKDFLAAEIFAPLGMTRTSAYVSRFATDPDFAHGLIWRSNGFEPVALAKSDSTMHAAGGLCTTSGDLARWVLLHLERGELDGVQLLESESADAMLEPHAESSTDFQVFQRTGMGLAWNLGTVEDVPMVSHHGGYVGFGCHCSFLPEEGVGVVVLCNDGSGAGSQAIHLIAADVYSELIGTEGADELWPQLIDRFQRDPAPPPSFGPGLLSHGAVEGDGSYEIGTYENADWGTLEIYLQDGELAARIGNWNPRFGANDEDDLLIELFPGSRVEGRFVRPNNARTGPVLGIEFYEPDDDETVYFKRVGPSSHR